MDVIKSQIQKALPNIIEAQLTAVTKKLWSLGISYYADWKYVDCEKDFADILTPSERGTLSSKMNALLSKATGTPSMEINLLIMGDSGVGKSTAINSIISCLQYNTLAEAERRHIEFPIPMNVTLPDPKSFEKLTVSSGKDVNENYDNEGQSVTQLPQTLLIPYQKTLIRLIDTPGLNDTRGREQDEKNVAITLSHLAEMKSLNAIIILLKADINRISESFVFCLTKILENLHYSVTNNIIFCITFARSCNFKPGNTITALKECLAKNDLAQIKVTPDTVFFVDNAAVPYLIGRKNGVKVSDRDRRSAEECWNESSKAIGSLLRYVKSVTPVEIRSVVCLQSVRQTITCIIEPLLQVAICIGRSINDVESKKSECEKLKLTKKELEESPLKIEAAISLLMKTLYCTTYELETEQLGHRCLICKRSSCGESIGGHTIYRICQQRTDTAISPGWCDVMSGFANSTCNVCKCSSDSHEFRTYKTKVRSLKKIDGQQQRKIDENRELLTKNPDKLKQCEAIIKMTQGQIDSLATQANTYKEEQRQMIATSATLTVFQQKTVIYREKQVNDRLANYLEDQIASAKGDKTSLQILTEMRDDYAKRIQEENNREQQLSPAEIYQLIEKMYKLPNFGSNLEHNVRAIQVADSKYLRPEKEVKLKHVNNKYHKTMSKL